MGRYDDITGEQLRIELATFARLLLRMEEKGILLERSGAVLRLLGELRRMVFAWEVRNTHRDEPDPATPDPSAAAPEAAGEDDDSLRIVREALEREAEFLEGLQDGGDPPSD